MVEEFEMRNERTQVSRADESRHRWCGMWGLERCQPTTGRRRGGGLGGSSLPMTRRSTPMGLDRA